MNIPETDISLIAKVIGPRSPEAALPINLDDVIPIRRRQRFQVADNA